MENYEPGAIISENGKHKICCYSCYANRTSVKKFSDSESMITYFSSFGWHIVKGKWHCKVCSNIVYYARCEKINKCILQRYQVWPVRYNLSGFDVPDNWISVEFKKDIIGNGGRMFFVDPKYLHNSYEDALASLLEQIKDLAKDLNKE